MISGMMNKLVYSDISASWLLILGFNVKGATNGRRGNRENYAEISDLPGYTPFLEGLCLCSSKEDFFH